MLSYERTKEIPIQIKNPAMSVFIQIASISYCWLFSDVIQCAFARSVGNWEPIIKPVAALI